MRIAKTTFSVSCGSRRTSATSASSACSRSVDASPEASRITGAGVCSRIAASSSCGSVARARRVQDDVQVAAAKRRSRLAERRGAADEVDLQMALERLAKLGQALAVAGDEDADPLAGLRKTGLDVHVIRLLRPG